MTTSYIDHVFARLISVPRFKSNNFYQNWPKFNLFLPKKHKIFERLWLRPQILATPPIRSFLAMHLDTSVYHCFKALL